MLLEDRVAIITGGTRGIGKGIALRFAEEGCSPIIADILTEGANETLEEISKKGREGFFVQCDVSNSSQVQNMVDSVIRKFRKVDILVNNAGTGGSGARFFTEVPEEEWDLLLNVNLKGAFLCCRAVAPIMKEKKYGKIVNMSSIAAISPNQPNVHYSASKAGLLGLTMDLALQLAPFNVCVNAILPGLVPTPIWNPFLPDGVDREAFFAGVVKGQATPLQRMGTPEDIAGAALFLASDLSAYVTGDRILVGGGIPLRFTV